MAYWFLLILPLQKQGPITEISRLGAKVRKPSRKFSASLRERQRCQVHFHHGSNLSLALKRKTPTCLWRRKQEPFSSRATTGTRGQEVTSHVDSLACLTANLSCSCRCAGIEEVTPLATEVPSARHRHRCCARGEEGAEGVRGGAWEDSCSPRPLRQRRLAPATGLASRPLRLSADALADGEGGQRTAAQDGVPAARHAARVGRREKLQYIISQVSLACLESGE